VSGRVPQHIVDQIARSVDFVHLVSRHVKLEKRGERYWALCPFHTEKTPSFSVDPDNSLYYCFGCKEGGNVFTFVQKMDGLSFPEALRALAAEAGVDLTRYEDTEGPTRSEVGRLRDLHELATTYYQKCLGKSKPGRDAAGYLHARGIRAESIEQWRLGYSPQGWDHFVTCAVRRGYDCPLLVRSGLARPREGAQGCYDAFRNRLMFPITDAAGRTIAFGARALATDDEPKYLNSPETPLFSKGSCFFGLSQAKAEVRAKDTAVVLEGYTDVIMAHQAGVTHAVAVLGTALTERHARALARLCDRAVLVFDADEAGQRSAERGVETLLNCDLDVRVARLPAGSDPCEVIAERGGDAFRQALDDSIGFFEFRLELARSRHDAATVAGKAAVFDELAGLAGALRDQAKREMVVRWTAEELGVSPRSVWASLQDHAGRTAVTGRRTGPAPTTRPVASADESLPRELLGLLLARPDLVSAAADRVELDLIRDCAEKEVLAQLLDGREGAPRLAASGFFHSLRDPRMAAAASGALAEEQVREARIKGASARERLNGYLGYLQRKKEESSGLVDRLDALDDEQLRALERKLKDKDRRSAQLR
jgi:DNA primase